MAQGQKKTKKIQKQKKKKGGKPESNKFRKSQPNPTPSDKKLQSRKQVHVHKSNKDITKVINKNIEAQMMQRVATAKEKLSILK